MKTFFKISLSSLVVLFLTSGCKVTANPNQNDYVDGTAEVARQISDVMASIDEMGGSSGTLQTLATCYGNGFGACSSNTVTRNFANCSVGSFLFSGTVSLTWGGSSVACVMQNPGDSITRHPNYSMTGARSGTLSVFKDGTVGERITWASGSGTKVFNYSNDGVRRTISVGGVLYYDVTTSTAGDITITGQNRSNRVMNGGALKVLNNLNGQTCVIAPQNVSWSDTNCTCASSGSWVGTCGGTLFRMDLRGCGSAQMMAGNYSEMVTLDRCANN
jgi:hypothetical protein